VYQVDILARVHGMSPHTHRRKWWESVEYWR